MAAIQPTTGLMSGIPITDTVNKLMQLAGASRDALTATNNTLKTQQTDETQLAALLVAVKSITQNLGQDSVYNAYSAASSNSAALAATVTGQATAGSYQFTPLRQAQNQQWLSSAFQSTSDPIGSGTLTFRFGSDVGRSLALSQINGGAGFTRGSIRITDHSGAHADIDLSAAQTVGDVLAAINNAAGVSVTAQADGDRIRLTDNTGLGSGRLQVQEVSGGHTAASLGLAAINTTDPTASGQDIVRLYAGLDLGALNDGRGVRTDPVFPDIEYHLSNGHTGTIDLSPIQQGSSQGTKEKTLGDVLKVLNAADPTDLKFEIAPDGSRIVATDLTGGTGQFTLSSSHGSGALADLGLDQSASGATITGRRVIGGLGTVLLSSLNGGKGVGTLGGLSLTDRAGGSATIDLSGAETLADVLDTINAAGLGIAAGVNAAGNGIELTDTTGASTGQFTVTSADGTAAKLHIGVGAGAGATAVNSGDLHLQVVSENTRLSDLNGGAGVGRGTMWIRDTVGYGASVDLGSSDIQTLGDVLRAIDRMGLHVDAQINDTGDGIRLVDTGYGTGTLSVTEGSSTTAHDLHLDRAAADAQIGGQATKVIDGTTTYTVQIGVTDTLATLTSKINVLGAGVSATTFTEATGQSYRLGLTSQQTGRAGNLVIDASAAGFALDQTVRGQDALLMFGGANAPGANLIVSSPSNKFSGVVPGVDLTVKQASSQPVSVTVSAADTNVVAAAQSLVDNFNKFRTQLTQFTAYNADTNASSPLTGDFAALRLDTDLSMLLSGQFGTGTVRSFAQLGITINNDGTLAFDQTKLQAAYAADPAAVKQFFTAKDVGVSDRFNTLIEQLAGADNSLLSNRIAALNDTIQWNQDRIDAMNTRLDAEQTRLLTEFYNMDAAIGKMKSALNVISQIAPIDFLAFNTASSSSTG